MEEIEVKFLEVNTGELKSKLENLGANFVGSFLYKEKAMIFQIIDLHKIMHGFEFVMKGIEL